MIEAFQGVSPTIAASSFVHEQTTLIGNIKVGEDSSVWPGVVMRGDVNHITVGDRTSIQDNTVVHVSHDGPITPGGAPCIIGDDVTIGHMAMLHGCKIGNRVLIGIGVTILDNAIIEDDVIIGAGSLVTPGKILKSGFLYLGSPVRSIRPLTDEEHKNLVYSAHHYVKLKNQYS